MATRFPGLDRIEALADLGAAVLAAVKESGLVRRRARRRRARRAKADNPGHQPRKPRPSEVKAKASKRGKALAETPAAAAE